MTQTDLFTMLGAPLVNPRWSWGAVRKADGAVFLRIWEDRMQEHEGCRYFQITHSRKYRDKPNNNGDQERLRQVELVRKGAPCYLIMCEAEDVAASPRKIKRFTDGEVFPGGRTVELDGDWWIELRPSVPVRHAMIPRSIPEEVPFGSVYREGSVQQILVNRYERDPKARAACVAHYGPACVVCGFNFADAYGPLAAGITHVHHLKPLAEVGDRYEVDPVADLRPVCPNCHAVIHQGGGCRSIDEVKRLLRR